MLSASVDVRIKGETRLIETGVFIKSDEWFSNLDSEGNCYGRGVSESELTRVD